MCTPLTTATEANISVLFTWDGGPQWQIVGGTLPGSTSAICYAVIWSLASGSASGANLTGYVWKPPAPPPLPSTCTMPVVPQGAVAAGVDNTNVTLGNAPQKFRYRLQATYTPPGAAEPVEYHSDQYLSPDPEIVLEPPGV
jgi:hypothetical protein